MLGGALRKGPDLALPPDGETGQGGGQSAARSGQWRCEGMWRSRGVLHGQVTDGRVDGGCERQRAQDRAQAEWPVCPPTRGGRDRRSSVQDALIFQDPGDKVPPTGGSLPSLGDQIKVSARLVLPRPRGRLCVAPVPAPGALRASWCSPAKPCVRVQCPSPRGSRPSPGGPVLAGTPVTRGHGPPRPSTGSSPLITSATPLFPIRPHAKVLRSRSGGPKPAQSRASPI